MEINLAEAIRHLLSGIKDLGGLQILLVVLIVECLWFAWALFLRHRATIAYMKQVTQTTIASMEEQRKLTIASMEEQRKLTVANLQEQTKLMVASMGKLDELKRTVAEVKREVERMGLEQSEAQW